MEQQQLVGKTSTELVDMYNSLARLHGMKTVNRFSDRKTAIRRVADLSKLSPTLLPKAEAEPKPAPKIEPQPELEPAPKPRVGGVLREAPEHRELKLKAERRSGFNFEPAAKLKPIREGTLRAALRDACAKGATFEELQEVTRQHDISAGKEPYDVKIRTYEGVRLLHFYVGYGLCEDADKKIHLVNWAS